MRIQILGTRGEIESSKPYHSRHSGILIDDFIIMDLGEKDFLSYNPDYVFITHLHPDHAFFTRKSYKESVQFTMPVYAPEKSPDFPDIKKIHNKKQVDSYVIQPIPTHHSKKVVSQAYIITHNKQRIVYTGDLIWINKVYHHFFDPADLIITEASFLCKGGRVQRDKVTGQIYGHTGIPDLVRLFKPYTNHILFMHFGEWFYQDIPKARKKITQLSRQYNIDLKVGYDGMQLETTEFTF